MKFSEISEFAKYTGQELVDKHEPYYETYSAINKNIGLQVMIVVLQQPSQHIVRDLLSFTSDIILSPLEAYFSDNNLYLVYQLPSNVVFLQDFLADTAVTEEMAWNWMEQLAALLLELQSKKLILGNLNFKYFTVIKDTQTLLYFGQFQLYNEYSFMPEELKRAIFIQDVKLVGLLMLCCVSAPFFRSLQPKADLLSSTIEQKNFLPRSVVVTAQTKPPKDYNFQYSQTLCNLLENTVQQEELRISTNELYDHPVISASSTESSILSYVHFQYTDFEVIKEIGRGGYGRVDLAIHTKSHQQCVLKQSNNLKIQRFEGELLRKLSHPNVVRFYGQFEERNINYLCIQYCNQGDLFNYIQKNGRPECSLASKWIAQLSSALFYMHSKGLIHRDLKPQNILISNNDAYIADFGVSKEISIETSTVVGTPLYYSPELYSKQKYGKESDVFSLGLVFFNILVGSHLFSASMEDINQFFRDLKEDGDISDQIDYIDYPEMRNLVLNMLKYDSAARYTMEDVCNYGVIKEQIRRSGLPGPDCMSVLSLQRVIRADFDLSALFIQTETVKNLIIAKFRANKGQLKGAFNSLLQFLPNYIKVYFNLYTSQYINYFSKRVAYQIQNELIYRQYINKIYESSVFADSNECYIEVSPSFAYQKRGKQQIIFTVALIVDNQLKITDDVFICCSKLVFNNDSASIQLNGDSVLAFQQLTGKCNILGQCKLFTDVQTNYNKYHPFKDIYSYSTQIDIIGQFANLSFPWMFSSKRGYYKAAKDAWE